MWQRRFAADPAVVGQVIRLTGIPHTVIGVMPRGFLLPPIFGARLIGADVVVKEADFWTPAKLDGMPRRRDARMLFVLGRLKAGRSIEENQAEASIIGRRLAADYPVEDFGMDFTVVPLRDAGVDERPDAPGSAVVRRGAGPDHRRHQRGAPSAGGFVDDDRRDGGAVGAWRVGLAPGIRAGHAERAVVRARDRRRAARRRRRSKRRWPPIRKRMCPGSAKSGSTGPPAPSPWSSACALALAISLLPIVYARKAGSARSVTATPVPVGMPRWRRLFVVLQLAVAVIVLSTAALLFRSADALSRVNPGFVAEGVSVFELMLPDSRYGTPARRIEFQRRLLDAVADLPGGAGCRPSWTTCRSAAAPRSST